jgi:hypothetical protein
MLTDACCNPTWRVLPLEQSEILCPLLDSKSNHNIGALAWNPNAVDTVGYMSAHGFSLRLPWESNAGHLIGFDDFVLWLHFK